MELKKGEGEHPADVVNISLLRISGILTSLAGLFDERREMYAVDLPFVAQSVKALVKLTDDASVALNDLYNSCDLAIIETTGSADDFPQEDQELLDMSLLRDSVGLRGERASLINDAPASSYEELLQKVTAAEVFAQAQASQIAGGEASMLLPILDSLKKDILRMKRVA